MTCVPREPARRRWNLRLEPGRSVTDPHSRLPVPPTADPAGPAAAAGAACLPKVFTLPRRMGETLDGESLEKSLWFTTLFQRHRGVLERAAREGLIVCVPQTCSLSAASSITPAAVAHHVLRRKEGADARGEFTTLSDRTVAVSGSRLSAGAGFPAPASAALLDSKSKFVELPGGASGKLQLYFISRPLEGGIDAPASFDEMTEAALGELLGFLRMSPGAEAPLVRLREQVELLAVACETGGASLRERAAELLDIEILEEGEGEDSGSGGGGPPPPPREWEDAPLAQALQHLLSGAAEEVVAQCSGLARLPGASAGAALDRQVLLSLQAECCRRLHAPVLALLRGVLRGECSRLAAALAAAAALPPQALGLKKRYACNLTGALGALVAVPRAPCPLSKLQALAAARAAMVGCLEAHLRAEEKDLSEEDFGADDELPLMTALLALAWAQGAGSQARAAAAELPLHVAYIQVCHHPGAAALQRSRLGYTLANWDSAMRWEPPEGAAP